MQTAAMDFRPAVSRNSPPGARARGLWLGLWLLAPSAGCGQADPRDPQAGAQQELICLPVCKPGPVTLLSGVTPTSIALSDTNAYFTNASIVDEVARVPIAGGAKTILATASQASLEMTSLVRVESSLFWARLSDSDRGGVWTVSTSGGAATQLSHHAGDVIGDLPTQALASYASSAGIFNPTTHLLFGDTLLGQIYDTRLSLLGVTDVSLLPAFGPCNSIPYPFALVLDAKYVYFTHDGDESVYRAPRAGGTATPLVECKAGVKHSTLAIDGSTLFFQQHSELKQVAVTGGAVSTFAPVGGPVTAMVAQSGVVYWACGSCGSVVKKSVAGGDSAVVASRQGNVRSLAVDDKYVYFGTDTALKRVAK